MVNKYQVFISATFEDLKEERKKVQDTILSMSQFPAGMEMFNASNEEPWEIVRQAIDNSDFYVLIIGHKYGSVIEDGKYAGISFTQREYYYALEKEIPVFAFLIDSNASVTQDKVEQETVKKEKLEAFKKEIMTRHHVVTWMNKYDLASKVSIALSHKFKNEPEWMTEKKNESEKKETKLDQKEVNENKQEPQREIESRHRMECQMNKDDLATEVSVELSKEINKGKKPECIGEQCLEKDKPEREIISLGQQGKEINENKQEPQKEGIVSRHHMEQDDLATEVSIVLSKEINEGKKSECVEEQCLEKDEQEREIISLGQIEKEINKLEAQEEAIDDTDKELDGNSVIKIFFIGIIVIAVVIIILRGFFWISHDEEIIANENTELREDKVQESQKIDLNKDNQEGESVEVNNDNKEDENMGREIESLEENDKNSEVIDWEWEYQGNADDMRLYLKNTPSELGIDVSKYQGTIDWEKVKADGIDFAIIRVGSRGYGSGGNLYSDSKFKENMDGAIANGIKTGVYFYSQATNRDEVDEEIDKILKDIEGYSLDYPIGVELICERDDYRTYELSTTEHQEEYIDLIKYFCNSIKQNGYTPMIYGTMEWFQQFPEGSFDGYYKWIYSRVAPNNIDNCIIWQYERGTSVVDGISNVSVDLSVYNGENE